MPDHDSSSRTVTVATCDHGSVAFWEPDWCTGSQSEHQPCGYRVGITHASPDYEFTTSSRGTAGSCGHASNSAPSPSAHPVMSRS